MASKAPIVIDGANVAHWNGGGNGQQFSCRGLLICLAYFKNRNHPVYIILPQRWQTKSQVGDLVDGDVLTALHKNNLVSYAPAGTSDDEFIIHFAQIKNAIIVTNDRLIKEKNLRPDWKAFVSNRLLTYTFVRDDFVPHPNPLGAENSMTLEMFLTGSHLGVSNVSPNEEKSTEKLLEEVLNLDKQQSGSKGAINEKATADGKGAKKGNGGGQKSNPKGKPDQKIKGTEKQPPKQGNPNKSKTKPEVVTVVRQPQENRPPGLDVSNGAIPKTNNPKSPNQKSNRQSSDSPASSPKPRMIYGLGIVTEIRTSYGQIELPNVKNKIIFFTNAYQSELECADLTQRFPKGKSVAVGFEPLKANADESKAIEASIVCPMDELVHGYGKVIGDVKFHGFNVSPCPSQLDGKVYCPANSFHEKNVSLKELTSDSWIDFMAMPQYPIVNKRPYVSVNTILSRTEGVIVKATATAAYAWSRLAGFVSVSIADAHGLSPEAFKLGVWLEFRLNQTSATDDCLWRASDVRIITPKMQTTLAPDGPVLLSQNGYAGFMKGTSGSIYCHSIGIIVVDGDCLKQCQNLRLNPMQKVSVVAKFSSPPNMRTYSFAWRAVDVKPHKFSNVNKSVLFMVKNVDGKVVEKKPNFAYVKTDKYGDVYAKNVDCSSSFDNWKIGDSVKGAVVVQELPQKLWRAFCFDSAG